MSFFIHSLVRLFLADQTIRLVQQGIQEELQARNPELAVNHQADFAVLFPSKPERNGLLDACPRTTLTWGNGVSFHTVTFRKKRLVMAETGSDPVRVTEAVLDIFKPFRVISAGFAVGLVPEARKYSFFVPNEVLNSRSESMEIWKPNLLAGTTPYDRENNVENQTPHFSGGTLISGTVNEKIVDAYHPFAQDSGTFDVLKTCREWNVPCFPLKIIVRCSKTQTPRRSVARNLGAFVKKTWENPKSVLETFHQQEENLVAGDRLAKKIIQLFLNDC
ncbi:MAG: hypothetical protein LBQ54_04210 [Planctomycetaceae bacterium]|jgi:hypothetical protein|nr:hypothetical protein [Planctomycetaceae bacterium]